MIDVVMELSSNEELSLSSFGGNIQNVQRLLSGGANPASHDSSGLTPLHRAAIGGHAAVMKLLIDSQHIPEKRRSLVNTLDKVRGLSMVGNAARFCARLTRFPLPTPCPAPPPPLPPPPPPQFGDGALHYAAYCGFADVVNVLVAAGADVNAIGADGRTPLGAARTEGNAEIMALLSECGASGDGLATRAEVADEEAATSGEEAIKLCLAARSGDVRLLHSLLAGGLVSVDARDAQGATPLHYAALHGSNFAVELLLGHGADFAARDRTGATPLHTAAAAGHCDVAHALLAAGADDAAADAAGRCALDIARLERNMNVERLLTGQWSRIAGLDFSHGVLLEGELYGRRAAGSFAAQFWKWKPKHVILSRAHYAMFFWSGTANTVNASVTRLAVENIASVLHDKSIVRVGTGMGMGLGLGTGSKFHVKREGEA